MLVLLTYLTLSKIGYICYADVGLAYIFTTFGGIDVMLRWY